MQIRLALDQITKDKRVNLPEFNQRQLEMYAKVNDLADELDIERGVGRARQ